MVHSVSTRPYVRRTKSVRELTDDEFALRKQQIENYCADQVKDFNQFWSGKYYFSNTPYDFVKLMKYHPYQYSSDINKDLEGINFERIERDTTSNFLEGLDQARHIINSLNKTYRQRIINSNELTNFILALLELDEFTEKKDINRFTFAQNLFNTTLKILIDESPKPIRKHMIDAIMKFYEFAKLPIELGYKHDFSLIKPRFEKIDGTDEYQIILETKLAITKPNYSKNK